MKKKNDQQKAEFLQMLTQCQGILIKLCKIQSSEAYTGDDLFQDVVYALWESWPTYKGKSSPKTWAIHVAINVIGQYHRRRRHEPKFVRLDEKILQSLAAIEEEADNEPDLKMLFALMEHLRDDERNLLALRLERMSIEDISAATGLGLNAVKQRLYRIKQKLTTAKNKIKIE